MVKRCKRCSARNYGKVSECENCGLPLQVEDKTAMVRNTWKPMGYEE